VAVRITWITYYGFAEVATASFTVLGRLDDMDRIIQRVLPLLACCLGAVAPDIEHATSVFFGTAWSYGLHGKVALSICLIILVALGIGYGAKMVLKEK
jgi:hypothetical protein